MRGAQPLAIVVLDQEPLTGNTLGLAQQQGWVARVMEDVGEENRIERIIIKGNATAIEYRDRSVCVFSSKGIQSSNVEIRSLGTKGCRKSPLPSPYVENLQAGRGKPREPGCQNINSPVDDEPIVQGSNRIQRESPKKP